MQMFVFKGNTPTQIKNELISVYNEDSAPSFTTVTFWVAEFKRGVRAWETATTDENITEVHQILIDATE